MQENTGFRIDSLPKAKLDFRQKLSLRLLGYAYLGEARISDSSPRPTRIYAFKCPNHGIVAAYPSTHDPTLYCHYCLDFTAQQSDRNLKMAAYSTKVLIANR